MNTRRAWIIEQLAALVRNGAIPKSDAWIQTILDWLAVHGLFIIAKKAEKSAISAVSMAQCTTPHASPSFPLPFLILPLFTRPRATACGAGEMDAWMPFGRFFFSPSLPPARSEKLYGY